MADIHEALSDPQKQAVRYLSENREHSPSSPRQFARQKVIDATGLTDDEYLRLVMFLERKGVIRFQRHTGVGLYDCFFVDSAILDIVHQLDHPPPKDYLKDADTLIRSKWWLVALVYFPALAAYIIAVVALLRLVGILELDQAKSLSRYQSSLVMTLRSPRAFIVLVSFNACSFV